ncbi:MAG: dihydrodipicolinate synthase family protein [Actinomycetes bacterium]
MSSLPLHGLVAAVPTAFHDDGALDLDGLAALVAVAGDAGARGVLVLGADGEPGTLDPDERRRVVTVAQRAAGGLPVLVGLGAPRAEVQEEAARLAVDLGAAALVAVLGADDGADERVARLASHGPPLVLTHDPARSGRDAAHGDVVALAAAAGVAAVVAEAPSTPDLVAAAVAADLPAFGGGAGLLLVEELESGAGGTVCGGALPELLAIACTAHAGGDASAARDAHATAGAYLRLEAQPGTAAIAVRKEAWRQRGVLASGRLRRGRPLDAATKRAVTRRLRDAGVSPTAPWPDA